VFEVLEVECMRSLRRLEGDLRGLEAWEWLRSLESVRGAWERA
jgi:hypothetical protein